MGCFFGMLRDATVGAKSGPGGAKSGPGGARSTPGETNPGGRPAGRAGPRLVQEAGSLYEARLAGLGWHGSRLCGAGTAPSTL